MNTIKYKNYLGSIEPDLENNILSGKILFINDLITFEGKTVEELRKDFEEAVDDYLAACAEFGDEPDVPFSGSFNVRTGKELHRQASIAAAEENIKLNELVKRALSSYLEPKTERHLHVHNHTVKQVITEPVTANFEEPLPWIPTIVSRS